MCSGLRPTISSISLQRSSPLLAGAHPVDDQRLGHDLAEGHARVERGVRILEDELHVAPVGLQVLAAQLAHVGTLKTDRRLRWLPAAG